MPQKFKAKNKQQKKMTMTRKLKSIQVKDTGLGNVLIWFLF